jgi:F-type H+-transporting ATPase subunit epsilon
MAETFAIEIVTPERLVVKDVAEEAQIPGKNGYMGILPGHAPLISELAVGEISYRINDVTNRIAVAWGFAEVLPDKLTILAETAERPEEIDVQRAEKAKARAEKKLADGQSEEECREALGSLAKAQTRIEIAEKK